MTKTARQMGPLALYRPKSKYRVQGVLTMRGASLFEKARRELARRTKRRPTAVSDGDTIEYLTRDRKLPA